MKNKFTVDYANAWRMGIDLVATGSQLKKYRIRHNLTQEELSGLFEDGGDSASRVSISLWENGKKLPSLSHLVFLRNLYSCTLDELICGFPNSDEESGDGDQPVVFCLWACGLISRRKGCSLCGGFFVPGTSHRIESWAG